LYARARCFHKEKSTDHNDVIASLWFQCNEIVITSQTAVGWTISTTIS